VAWWTWEPVSGVLVRRVSATVLNVSDRGCLIETAAPLEPGTIALLELEGVDRARSETVRVCHSIARPGAAVPFRAGTEFLAVDPPASPGQEVSAETEIHRQRLRRLALAGENSGSGRTTLKPAHGAAHRERGEDP
jgi:hypothetical protein